MVLIGQNKHPRILKTVQEIHHLNIKKKVPLDEAVERVRKTRNKALNLAATPMGRLSANIISFISSLVVLKVNPTNF